MVQGVASVLLDPFRLPDRQASLSTTTIQLAAVHETRTIVFLWNSNHVHLLFLDRCPLCCPIVLVVRAPTETLLCDGLLMP